MKRVLEIGHVVAGPTAGLLLSDLGYEVIKIESPGKGDISRRLTGTSSGAFPFYNRGKKSLTVDLTSNEGREIFLKLVESADIVIDNLGPGAMTKLSLSFSDLTKRNFGLIFLSLKGYGKGPYQTRKSLDYPIEVHSGLAYMTGLSGRPMRAGASLVDMAGAMIGVIAVLNAEIARFATGKGKYIEIGLFETAAFLVGQHIATFQLNKRELKPINEEGFAWGIYDFFKSRDNREIFIAVTTDNQWKDFCRAFELTVCTDSNLDSNAKRFASREFLIGLVSEKMLELEYSEIIERLTKANVAYAVLNKPWDLLTDIQLSSKLITETYNEMKLSVPSSPLEESKLDPPPILSEHTESLLKALGYTERDVKSLRERGII
ncbi:MAG: CoA transferase [Candidatus Thermoplasmatota archaeon]|nr:CoA transferase [Candidatus Thermoplasmatota archaeon]